MGPDATDEPDEEADASTGCDTCRLCVPSVGSGAAAVEAVVPLALDAEVVGVAAAAAAVLEGTRRLLLRRSKSKPFFLSGADADVDL